MGNFFWPDPKLVKITTEYTAIEKNSTYMPGTNMTYNGIYCEKLF
jgi:hypothetical protein